MSIFKKLETLIEFGNISKALRKPEAWSAATKKARTAGRVGLAKGIVVGAGVTTAANKILQKRRDKKK